MRRSVVVGVDGSPRSLAAADLAAEEAQLRRLPLRVVRPFLWPDPDIPYGQSSMRLGQATLRRGAEQLLADALERARSAAPDVDVDGEVVPGAGGAVLVAESWDAAMVVTGDQGLGGFSRLLVGSVAVQLAAHAECPVLVVRGDVHRSGPVVLAVDGSPEGAAAVAQAFLEASLRDAPLVVLHTWFDPVSRAPGDTPSLVHDLGEVHDEDPRLLAEAIAGRRAEYPDVVVREERVRRRTRAAVVDRSAGARLLVVGMRGLGGMRRLLVGSVTRAVLHHAACPVLVVPSMTPEL